VVPALPLAPASRAHAASSPSQLREAPVSRPCSPIVRALPFARPERRALSALLLTLIAIVTVFSAAPAAAQMPGLPTSDSLVRANICAQSTTRSGPSVMAVCVVSPQVLEQGVSVTGVVGANSYTFTVNNTGNGSGSVTTSASCSGAVACSASGSLFILPGAGKPMTVNFTGASSGGTGIVFLSATDDLTGAHTSQGYINVTIPPPPPTYNVSVTPGSFTMNAGTSTYNVTVTNNGTADATYSLVTSCVPMVSGCSAPASVFVPHGTSALVPVSITAGTPGTTGSVTLSASYGGYSNAGLVTVTVNNSYRVDVTPDGSSQVTNGPVQFTVVNLGSTANTFQLSTNVGSLSSSFVTLNTLGYPGVPVTVTNGSGTVILKAIDLTHNVSDSGSITMVSPTYTVSVGPDGFSDLWREAGQVDRQDFTVSNSGNSPATYAVTGTCNGSGATCTPYSASVPLGPGAGITVPITFTAGPPGTTATLNVNASGPSSDGGFMRVFVFNRAVAVTPNGQQVNVEPGTLTQTFTITNNGNAASTYNLTPTCSGVATGCASASQVNVTNGIPAQVNVTYSAATRGATGTVQLTAVATAGSFSGSGSVNVRVNDSYAVSVTPDNQTQSPSPTATFYVQNLGTSANTFNFSVNCGCTLSATTASISPGVASTLPVVVTLNGFAGTVTFTASDPVHGISDTGSIIVPAATYTVSVSPDTIPNAVAQQITANTQGSQAFSIYNSGNSLATYSISVSCPSTYIASCSWPTSLQVPSLATGSALVTFTATGIAGVGTIILTASAQNTSDVGTAKWQVNQVNTHYSLVSPKGGTATATVGSGRTQVFRVKNTGNVTNSYTLTTPCLNVVTACSAAPASVSNLAAGDSASVTVTYTASAAGTGTARLATSNTVDPAVVDTGSVNVTVSSGTPTYTVAVTPNGQQVNVEPGTSTQTFTITNSGNTSATYTLTTACSGVATGCSASTSVPVTNGTSVPVIVTYSAATRGATGTVQLTAVSTAGSFSASGSISVLVNAVATVANNSVQFKDINPGTTIERSQCLIFSIVPDVASECGALRIAHTLPAVRTLGKARVPTLIYSSDQTQGPTLAVNVTLADTTRIPTSVQLVVVRTWPDGHNDTFTRTYAGSDWQGNRSRRLAVPNVASGSTGILRYSVAASLVYPTGTVLIAPVDNSELAFVDRTSSPFGGGWWLAGLEQLFPGQYDNSVLWVGGDGSTRKYVKQQTMTGADTVYLATALDRPDTLLRHADGKYQRQAGNGLFVEFDPYGLHVRTVNRIGYATVFTYNGSRLNGIQLPPWSGVTPAHKYTFAYNASSGLLDTVTAPSVNNRSRKVILGRNGATKVVSITEKLDSTYQVTFDASSSLIYTSRTDRRGVPTFFTTETSSPTIATFATGTGTGTDTVRHTFRTVGGIGAALGTTESVDSTYFRYDGPRLAPVLDITKIWLDRFGAPVRIVNALNQETRITRGDPRFPALVTETRAPNFFTSRATYDDRGNLKTSTQVAPYGGVDATTTYAWDTKWDEMVSVTLPEGEVASFNIDPTTGNRAWQQDARGATSRVNFAYYTDAARYGLLKSVTVPGRSATEPATAATTYDYDAAANLRLVAGARSEQHLGHDAIGRVVADSTKIDSIPGTPGYWQVKTIDFDLADRAIRTYESGTATALLSANANETFTMYNREGGIDSVRLHSAGTNNSGIYVRRRFTYDGIGRVLTEGVEQDGHAGIWLYDESRYDEAGNVKTRIARTGAVTTMTYDALNRVSTRAMPSLSAANPALGLTGAPGNVQVDPEVRLPAYAYTVPADVATFTYDPVTGALLDANNAWAKIHRTYFANGQVKTETQRLRTWAGDTTDASYTHRYDLTFAYDRNGRRKSLTYPSAFGSLTAGYGYDPVTGELTTVTDLQSKQIQLSYDYRGSLVKRLYPSATAGQVITERFHFTDDGDLDLWGMRRPGLTRDDLRNQTFKYDPRGKQLTVYDSLVVNGGQEAAVYDGLGQLMQATSRVNGTYSTSVYTLDGIGNVLSTTGSDATVVLYGNTTASSGSRGGYLYDPVTGRRTVSYDAASNGDTTKLPRPFITRYDAAGNVWWYGRFVFDKNVTQNERRSYYSANNVLMAADARTWDPLGTVNTSLAFSRALEEYRYDALGRRVIVLATRSCSSMIERTPGAIIPRVDCLTSTIRRTVWDGAAELAEIQMPAGGADIERDSLATEVVTSTQTPRNLYPFYGRVAYVYAPGGIDRPLAVTRFGYSTLQKTSSTTWQNKPVPTFTLYPIWNTHGQASGANTLAPVPDCVWANPGSVPTSLCVRYEMGSEWLPYLGVSLPQGGWHGSLLRDKSDAAGTKYRRNRYYDPQSGRFTQEDPIGLAGGLNVYGFANGDPVNFSDPFGLCPIAKDGIPCEAEYAPGVKVSSGLMHTALDAIAAEADRPLLVYGGDRSAKRNSDVGGATRSSHLKGEAADVIFEGTSKKETLSILYNSEARANFGVRLLYHQKGSTLPEHSHLDLQQSGDITEQQKGQRPKYVPLKEPLDFP
jgi:RHS repeat-associated protein